MNILIDADACPVPVKEIVFRASKRLSVAVCLVANRPLRLPPSSLLTAVCVPGNIDEADHYIAERAQPGDLVVTADIPLAARVIDKGATALNPRGEIYTVENIAERLSVRNFLDDMRAFGSVSGGPAAFSNQDKHKFSAALDRLLAQRAI